MSAEDVFRAYNQVRENRKKQEPIEPNDNQQSEQNELR